MSSIEKLCELAQKTGSKLIIHNQNLKRDLVIVSVEEFEKMFDDANKKTDILQNKKEEINNLILKKKNEILEEIDDEIFSMEDGISFGEGYDFNSDFKECEDEEDYEFNEDEEDDDFVFDENGDEFLKFEKENFGEKFEPVEKETKINRAEVEEEKFKIIAPEKPPAKKKKKNSWYSTGSVLANRFDEITYNEVNNIDIETEETKSQKDKEFMWSNNDDPVFYEEPV